jgi:energy-coupling factor transporter ATP-binding protein EcfA2
VLLRISCDYDRKIGQMEVLQADRPIIVRGVPVRNSCPLEDGDTIRVDAGQVLRCNFSERLIEEEKMSSAHSMHATSCANSRTAPWRSMGVFFRRSRRNGVRDGSQRLRQEHPAARAFRTIPTIPGAVLFNNRSFYENHDSLRKYVTYIPQYDAFDEHLTIEENLEFAAAIRAPHLGRRERLRRIDTKLAELGLNERRTSIVGLADKKILSGGERKRLNIGLDMVVVWRTSSSSTNPPVD